MTQLTIGILLFDGAEELDFVGPYEVFTMANFTASLQGKEPPFKVALISETGDDITGAKKMRFGIDYSLKTAPALDVICIPGGEGTRTLIHNRPVIDWVGKTAADCTWVTSVCTGAFVLSAAGLTKGRNMTTHWAAMNEFEKLGLKGNLQQGVRYVRDGNLVTAAGVSAGIDMALWLTGEIGGIPLARDAKEYGIRPRSTLCRRRLIRLSLRHERLATQEVPVPCQTFRFAHKNPEIGDLHELLDKSK